MQKIVWFVLIKFETNQWSSFLDIAKKPTGCFFKSGWITLFAYISSSRQRRMMIFGVPIKNRLRIHHVKFGSSGSKGLALACFLLIFFWKSKFLKGVHVVFWEKNSLVMFSMQNCPCMQISMLCWKMAAPFPLKPWLNLRNDFRESTGFRYRKRKVSSHNGFILSFKRKSRMSR